VRIRAQRPGIDGVCQHRGDDEHALVTSIYFALCLLSIAGLSFAHYLLHALDRAR
jgi:hypothetical protein